MARTVFFYVGFFLIACVSCTAGPAGSASTSSSSGKIVWVRYEDLAEHAFSFEAPQSWEVKGGAYRFGYFDVRPMIDVRSTDSKIIIRVNDANVPAYVTPGPHTPPEGQRYDKQGQFQTVVERYKDAKTYAERYATSRFKSACQSMTEQPSSWQVSVPQDPSNPTPAQETTASIAYSCPTSAGARIVSVYARTAHFQGEYGVDYWIVAPLITSVTSPENVGTGQAIAQHILNSFTKNPQWVAYQQRMTQAGIADIQRNYQAFLAQMQQYHNQRTQAWNQQVAGFEARQNASQAQSSSWGDTITGLTDARDPQTGESFKVWIGPNANYYINNLGNKVNANTSPGPGYREMQTGNQ